MSHGCARSCRSRRSSLTCSMADGASLLDEPYARRFAALAAAVPAGERVPRLVTSDAADAAGVLRSGDRGRARKG